MAIAWLCAAAAPAYVVRRLDPYAGSLGCVAGQRAGGAGLLEWAGVAVRLFC
jgi:hypothetical protein